MTYCARRRNTPRRRRPPSRAATAAVSIAAAGVAEFATAGPGGHRRRTDRRLGDRPAPLLARAVAERARRRRRRRAPPPRRTTSPLSTAAGTPKKSSRVDAEDSAVGVRARRAPPPRSLQSPPSNRAPPPSPIGLAAAAGFKTRVARSIAIPRAVGLPGRHRAARIAAQTAAVAGPANLPPPSPPPPSPSRDALPPVFFFGTAAYPPPPSQIAAAAAAEAAAPSINAGDDFATAASWLVRRRRTRHCRRDDGWDFWHSARSLPNTPLAPSRSPAPPSNQQSIICRGFLARLPGAISLRSAHHPEGRDARRPATHCDPRVPTSVRLDRTSREVGSGARGGCARRGTVRSVVGRRGWRGG